MDPYWKFSLRKGLLALLGISALVVLITFLVRERGTSKTSDWTSLDELKSFLREDNSNSHVGSLVSFDCDDFAKLLRDRAQTRNKDLSIVWIGPAEYYRLFGKELGPEYGGHMLNGAVIGNEFWYVEPQTDQVIFGINLD